jgi:hypothetical protein
MSFNHDFPTQIWSFHPLTQTAVFLTFYTFRFILSCLRSTVYGLSGAVWDEPSAHDLTQYQALQVVGDSIRISQVPTLLNLLNPLNLYHIHLLNPLNLYHIHLLNPPSTIPIKPTIPTPINLLNPLLCLRYLLNPPFLHLQTY